MDITGTINLWKDYDVTALPLLPTALSPKTENGVTVKEYYFDGYTTIDGRVRSFLRIHEHPNARAILLFLPDSTGDMKPARAMFERGYTVATLDYLGKRAGAVSTIYPDSLEACNVYGKTEFQAQDDILGSGFFIWTCAARRALRLIKQIYPEQKIFALGVGLGGSTVYKLCIFDDGLTAAATTLNILPPVRGEGNSIINYRAALDNNAYAQSTTVPLFISVASNDEDGSLDAMSELAQTTASLKCFRIVARAFKGGIKTVANQIDNYFQTFLNSIVLKPTPELTAANSENNLYFNISVKKPDGVSDERWFKTVELYAAFCVENPTHRNWTNIPIISLGNDAYLAHVDVLQDTKPVYAFVNMTDAYGNIFSSPVLAVVPRTLGIPSQSTVQRRMIYDGSLGTDVWTSPNGGTVSMKRGPYDIAGVTSDNNILVSFKPGDMLYTAETDSILQIIISGKPQNVTVEVSDGEKKYTTTVEITDSTEWHKFTLSPNDFKGEGTLTDLSKIMILKIIGGGELAISSVLWV